MTLGGQTDASPNVSSDSPTTSDFQNGILKHTVHFPKPHPTRKHAARDKRLRANAKSDYPTLKKRSFTKEEYRGLAIEFLKRFARGFASGVGLYTGVRIVTALLRNPFRESVPLIWHAITSKDCLAVASFLGLYPSVYHLLVKVLSRLRTSQDGWTYGIAGGLGGLSIALLDGSKRQTMAFFTLSRAMGAGISTLVARGKLMEIPYFEVMVYCACVSIIIYCTALVPKYLNRSYYRSIMQWSRDYTDAKLERCFRVPGKEFLTCAEVGLHEGSCTRHHLIELIRNMAGFAQLYFPIHLTPVLVFKRQLLLQRPLYVVASLARNLAWSTAFLGLTVFLAKHVICVLRNALRRPPPLPGFIPLLAGAVCGLGILLERASRRKELLLFVIPHVLNILYVAGQRYHIVQPLLKLRHGSTAVFALSMAAIMHSYERQPQSLTLLISGILRFFFGASSEANYAPESEASKIENKSESKSKSQVFREASRS